MKLLPILAVATITMLVGCSKSTSTITVNVKNSRGTLYCNMIVDKSFSAYTTDTIQITSDTTFTLTSPADRLRNIYMFGDVLKRPINTIVGEDFAINIDTTGVVYDGTNAQGREHYQQLAAEQNLHQYEFVRDFTKAPLDTVASVMIANLDALKAKDIAGFEQLKEQKKIDDKFLNFVKSDIELYYNTILTKVISSNYRANPDDTSKMYTGYAQAWHDIAKSNPITMDVLCLSPVSHYTRFYFNSYLHFRDGVGSKPESMAQYLEMQYKQIQDNITEPQVLQAYSMYWLFWECVNNKSWERGLIPLLKGYMEKYPDSQANKPFAKHIAEIENFYRIVSTDFSPEMKFVEKPEQIKTLQELISRFDGHNLFIDFWFTTCGPCVREFGYTKELKEMLKREGIEMLYVSIDRDGQKQNWENSIKYHNLTGNHIRVSRELHNDMDTKHGIYSYPTYMIVNSKGVIVEPRAKAPSSGEELLTQIREKLGINKK